MYFVYAIYNKDNDKIYIGQTEDLDVRINLHNNKKFANCYTSRFDGDWVLIYSEDAPDRKSALVREKQLKVIEADSSSKNIFRSSSMVEQIAVD